MRWGLRCRQKQWYACAGQQNWANLFADSAGRSLILGLALNAITSPGHDFQTKAWNRFLARFTPAKDSLFNFTKRGFDAIQILLFSIGDVEKNFLFNRPSCD